MIGIATKDCPISLKDDGFGTGQLTGYFSTWGPSPDLAGEVVAKGAFRNIREFIANGFILANHEMKSLPVATVDDATMDDTGLLIRGTFHSHPAAQAVRAVVRERLSRGKRVGTSIGYRVIDSEPTRINGKSAKLLKSIDLYEVSIVGVPCNPDARLVSAKRLTPELLSTKDLMLWLEQETKTGKVLSAENHAHLAAMHRDLSSTVARMGEFLALHHPDGPQTANPYAEPSVSPSRISGGGSVAKSDNPYCEGFEQLNSRRARLLEIKARMEELSNRALIAWSEDEERAEAAASKSRR